MKLPPLSKDKNIWLKEFDHWVTPYLEEIRDSEIFHKTIVNIKEAIDLLGSVNKEFKAPNAESVNYIVNALINGLKNQASDKQYSLVISFCDLCFLITGKTDNNYKCQFPIYLKEIKKMDKYPSFRGETYKLENKIPRVIKSEDIALLMTRIEVIKSNKVKSGTLENIRIVEEIKLLQNQILYYYFEYILNQDIYSRSLKIFGAKYFELKKIGSENDLLAPMIIAYVRGSASASSGHKPESILREHMSSWGLKANEDYNKNDVKPKDSDSALNKKTRAYDFVLPFNVKNWQSKIYIQSQFYAGDSGSVSHKNVDQTTASRAEVLKIIPKAKFVEYVDGGGYYGSLNGDLKKLFFMSDTENFFQVRSFSIKLRQLLQEINFLTPLELVHAIATTNFDLKKAKMDLKKEGYSLREIDRVIDSINKDILNISTIGKVKIDTSFYELSRRYYLLDCIAIFGKKIAISNRGNLLVPGYEEYYGSKVSEVLKRIKKSGSQYYKDWQKPQILAEDLEFLSVKEWVINT